MFGFLREWFKSRKVELPDDHDGLGPYWGPNEVIGGYRPIAGPNGPATPPRFFPGPITCVIPPPKR
jgi:hypothetical protein